MGAVKRKISKTFTAFFDSEKAGGLLLIACTIVSLLATNSAFGRQYSAFWHLHAGGLSLELWINDALMAIFFLLIGLELKREFYNGELADFKTALFPILAAAGGVVTPAAIHFLCNRGAATQAGIGIPMATDIAFALGALALLGRGVPASLKVFLTALAVMDDLAAIVVIAVFYTVELAAAYFFGALAVFGVLMLLNKARVASPTPYLVGGILLWLLMFKSGVHATIAGVLLGFAIPFSAAPDDEDSLSHQMEGFLQKPVAFVILPIFALCDTGISIDANSLKTLAGPNEFGIVCGLVIGKPLGIALASFIAVALKICRLPRDLTRKHIFGAGLLGGIGFTMSIFITNLAFAENAAAVNNSKLAILLASLTAGTLGFVWLKLCGRPAANGDDPETIEFAGD